MTGSFHGPLLDPRQPPLSLHVHDPPRNFGNSLQTQTQKRIFVSGKLNIQLKNSDTINWQQPWVNNFDKSALVVRTKNLWRRIFKFLFHSINVYIWNMSHVRRLLIELTWILEEVFGSRNPLTLFQISLNPLPAFTTYIWCSVCKFIFS